MGSLGFGFETPEEAHERVGRYWRLMREECHPIGKAANPALCILSQFACADDEQEAQQRAGDGGQFFSFSLNHYYSPVTGPAHKHARTNLSTEFTDTSEEERIARLQARRDQRDELASLASADAGILDREPEDENRYPNVIESLRAVMETEQVRAGLERGTIRTAPLMWPRFCAKLLLDEGELEIVFDRKSVAFGEAIQYYEFTLDVIVQAQTSELQTGTGGVRGQAPRQR